MCEHNTRKLSPMCDINDGLTALCVSQQRSERDHIHIEVLQTDSRAQKDQTGCYASVFSIFTIVVIGCLVINDRSRVLYAPRIIIIIIIL